MMFNKIKKYFNLGRANKLARIAVNGIEHKNLNISKEQADLIFENVKYFPNNTELSIALIKDGKTDFIGIKRINDTFQLVENTKKAFEIASITKVFTSTLLANLVVNNKISLDDEIEEYLDIKFKVKTKITFKQLANHTAGLSSLPFNLNVFSIDKKNPYKLYDEDKLVECLSSNKMRLVYNLGIEHRYSNFGAGLLGFVLSKVTNSSFDDLLEKNIFSKYGMLNSTTNREDLITPLVKGLTPKGEVAQNWDSNVLSGAGSILSTTEDLSKFALAQFNENNKELLLTQQATFDVKSDQSIGLGWYIIKKSKNKEILFHNGGTGGYRSSMALNKASKNGVVILSNVSAFNKQSNNIDTLCFSLLDKQKTGGRQSDT